MINLADNKVLFETNAADIKDISPSLKYVATTGYGETLPVISVATVKDPSIPVWDNKSESASHRGYPNYDFTPVDDILSMLTTATDISNYNR